MNFIIIFEVELHRLLSWSASFKFGKSSIVREVVLYVVGKVVTYIAVLVKRELQNCKVQR